MPILENSGRFFFFPLLSSHLYCCPLTTKITCLDYFFLFSFTRYVFGKDRLPSSLGSSKSEFGCNCEGYLEETMEPKIPPKIKLDFFFLKK